MKMKLCSAWPALVPVLLASGWAGDKPSYQPKAGTTLSKHIAIENELELDDMTMEIDGQDMSELAGEMELSMKVSMKLVVADQYVETGNGLTTRLKRSFEEISSNSHVSQSHPVAGSSEKDIPLVSELEGSTVVFSWDAGDDSYRVAFDGEDGDEELLEDLEENIDLRGFLPTSEVAEGDSWKIPAEAVKAALAPGGDIKLRPEGESSDAMGMDQMGGMDQYDLIGELDGEFEAVYKGTRKAEDGSEVAVISLKIDAKSAQDMADKLEEIKQQMKGNLPEGLEVDISALDGEYEYEAEGELLWNLEAGLVHGLNLSGNVRMIIDMAMNMKMGTKEQSMDISQTFVGNQTITLTTGD